ncbi:hypothetical protein EY643_11530 [Halioglobus maricola]|uniref:DUF3187 family protein n=1 Tax=Halioglobus maricola TaxID=2601894 RepID=A0A5P9NK77_9GAMM|nr:hypothetical protein [Halioglobus maricola]QFU76240.1 hypothetical protein EY643_11530 [Halioglobus maricola]
MSSAWKSGTAGVSVIIFSWILCTSSAAQEVVTPTDFIDLAPEDIGESLIAFINLTTAPGLSGATFSAEQPGRDSEFIRGSMGYASDLTLKDQVLDAYWGVALAYGSLEDQLDVLQQQGEAIRVDADRSILSLRGSAGLSLPITQHFTLRPYLSLAASQLEARSRYEVLGDIGLRPELVLDTEVDAVSTSGTLEASYDRWFGSHRLEASGQYTSTYTDTFNGSFDALDTWGWNETALAHVRYSNATGWHTRNKPWRWNTYASYTHFIGLDPLPLGFNAYTELGVGLDFEVNIRPLDWFGLRFIGLKAGYIFGDGVDGFSVGLSF